MDVPKEVLKKVKLLEINTRKVVNNLFSGEYHTVFKGQGMTFADFREYTIGDDIRNISWSLTAKAGKPYIKQYEEERELTVILAVDISRSTIYGSGEYAKGEVMAQLCALIAFSAVQNKDRVGLLLFSDQVEHFVPPTKGRAQVHRLLRDIFYFKPKGKDTKISVASDYLLGILKKRANIFLLSDFNDEKYEQSLKLLGRKHDVTALMVHDLTESNLPALGVVELEDAETGEHLIVDTEDKTFRQQFAEQVKKEKEKRLKILKSSQIDFVDICSQEKYVDVLIKFFQKRHRAPK